LYCLPVGPVVASVLTLHETAVGQTHVLVDLQPLAAANGCQWCPTPASANLRLPRRRPDHADDRRQSLPRVQTQEMAL